MPVKVRALGMTKKGTNKHINKTHGSPSQHELQKTVLCGTVQLFRRVLSMSVKSRKVGDRS